MKRLVTLLFFVVALMPLHASTADYQVVPLPRQITLQKGNPFVLTNAVQIVYEDGLQREAEFLKEYVGQLTGLQLQITNNRKAKNGIRLAINQKMTGQEAYRITVGQKGVLIESKTAQGVFYGIQTLRKSLAAGDVTELPAVIIDDEPRFSYRGVHLDCSRHFFPISFVKRYIDILALHNQNVFHWHLSDDQGWRIEIKRYPRLAEVGSKRRHTVIGHNSGLMDGRPYGGFYTQEEAREVVRYAAEQHITVIPEIDMPGHMLGLLTAYPEIGCTGGPYEVEGHWGVFDDILCAGNEKTFEMVNNILDEIIDIFPSQYIHIGGDEAPKGRWKDCPKCQARIREQGIKADGKLSAEMKLQGYFTNRVEQHVLSRGRRIIGWDEILEGDINQSAVVMSWQGMEGGLKASAKGHDVIMAPQDYCYFNFSQFDASVWNKPFTFNAIVTLPKAYSFEPAPPIIGEEAQKHVLGAQANLWSEYIEYENLAEYQLLPRLAALSECQWMQPECKDYQDFLRRAKCMSAIYDRCGWAHAKLPVE